MDYDVVVIGSGIGGLTSAAYLAKQGKRVLVCEQHSRPGGYFSSFKRRGYTFDGGTQSLEDVGMFFPMLKQLGLQERVRFSKSRFAIASPGFFCHLETLEDLSAFYDELIRLFPADRQGLSETRDLSLSFCRIFRDMLACVPNPVFQTPLGFLRENLPVILKNLPLLKAGGDFYRLLDTPLSEWMRRRIGNPDPVNIVCDVGFYGMNVSFGLVFIYFMMDYYYPLGGFQAISDAMADFIGENGGEVRCRALVEDILTEGGRAVGVRLAGGEEVRARYVVSNADMLKTFLELMPDADVPAPYRQQLLGARPAHSMFTVYLGLDVPPEELAVRGCHHIVIFPGNYGTDFSGIDSDVDFYRRCPVMISAPSLHDPSLAPPGKSVMCIQYYATQKFADNWGTEEGVPTPRYEGIKEMVAEQMIATTEKVVPGISDRIELKVTASPYTYERYSMNTGGGDHRVVQARPRGLRPLPQERPGLPHAGEEPLPGGPLGLRDGRHPRRGHHRQDGQRGHQAALAAGALMVSGGVPGSILLAAGHLLFR